MNRFLHTIAAFSTHVAVKNHTTHASMCSVISRPLLYKTPPQETGCAARIRFLDGRFESRRASSDPSIRVLTRNGPEKFGAARLQHRSLPAAVAAAVAAATRVAAATSAASTTAPTAAVAPAPSAPWRTRGARRRVASRRTVRTRLAIRWTRVAPISARAVGPVGAIATRPHDRLAHVQSWPPARVTPRRAVRRKVLPVRPVSGPGTA